MIFNDFIGGMSKLIRSTTYMAAIAASVMLFAVVLILNHMIVIRLLGYPVVWHLEMAIYLTIGSFFLGTPYAILSGGDVAIDLLGPMLSPRNAARLRLAVLSVMLATGLYLTWGGGYRVAEAFQSNLKSTSLWGPLLWPVYAAMPLGLGLACLQMLAELATTLRRLGSGPVR